MGCLSTVSYFEASVSRAGGDKSLAACGVAHGGRRARSRVPALTTTRGGRKGRRGGYRCDPVLGEGEGEGWRDEG